MCECVHVREYLHYANTTFENGFVTTIFGESSAVLLRCVVVFNGHLNCCGRWPGTVVRIYAVFVYTLHGAWQTGFKIQDYFIISLEKLKRLN